MTIGYARVSTDDQTVGGQVESLKKAGCEIVYQDVISGGSKERPALDEMLARLLPGDVVAVCKLDRLGRSTMHLLTMMEEFKARKVGFRILDMGIDTTTPAGELIFTIMSGIAQFERSLIKERTRVALAYKKSIGVRLGRPVSAIREDQLKQFRDLQEAGMGRKQIIQELKINKHRYYYLLDKASN